MSLLQRMLNPAFEDAEGAGNIADQANIILKGPLSEIYTKALYELYPKDGAEPSAPSAPVAAALESQAIDQALLERLSKIVAPADTVAVAGTQTVYGVAATDVTEQTVVDVTNDLAATPEGSDYVFIMDGTKPEQPSEQFVKIEVALECMVEANGGKFFRSFKDFMATRA